MAWKPGDKLREGELDNTTPGKVAGWLRFVGMKETVTLQLHGNFSPDVPGAKLRLYNPDPAEEICQPGPMEGFAAMQRGKIVNINAGRPGGVARIEWRSDQNGLVLLKLPTDFIRTTAEAAGQTGREG